MKMADDILCSGLLTKAEFLDLLAQCSFLREEQEVTFLGEIQPQRFITPKERQDLICIVSFDASIPHTTYSRYTTGRIFNQNFELRWQQEYEYLWVVYLGATQAIPYLNQPIVVEKVPDQKKYFLFGRRLTPERIKEIGYPAREGDFAEVRIPRLLHYPVPAKGTYVQIEVQEYLDPATDMVAFYRFRQLLSTELR
jgi:hypothetical protein